MCSMPLTNIGTKGGRTNINEPCGLHPHNAPIKKSNTSGVMVNVSMPPFDGENHEIKPPISMIVPKIARNISGPSLNLILGLIS